MEKLKGQAEAFCRKYLQCMDPDQAAAMAGCADGYAVLETKMVRRRLERMREAAAGQCTGRTWYGVWPSWLSAG